jgi:hypothetical protein
MPAATIPRKMRKKNRASALGKRPALVMKKLGR